MGRQDALCTAWDELGMFQPFHPRENRHPCFCTEKLRELLMASNVVKFTAQENGFLMALKRKESQTPPAVGFYAY